MTLIVGLIAKDGIVLASDSQMTFVTSGQSTRGAASKLAVFGGCVAVGIATDSGSTKQLVDEALSELRDLHAKPSVKDMREALTHRINEVFAAQTKRTIAAAGRAGPATSVVAACYVKGTPHLFEVSPDGLCCDHATTGFTAIGSGDIFTYHAMSTFSAFILNELPLAQAKVLVYRIVFDAIQVAASGIGGAVQMACVLPTANSGKAALLEQAELDALDYQLRLWRQLERETLNDVGLSGLGTAPEAALPVANDSAS